MRLFRLFVLFVVLEFCVGVQAQNVVPEPIKFEKGNGVFNILRLHTIHRSVPRQNVWRSMYRLTFANITLMKKVILCCGRTENCH